MKRPLRIGMIRYLNCLPFYFELEKKCGEQGLETSWMEASLADLNRALAAEEIDLAPVSSMEYLLRQKDYFLLPGIGIGSDTFVRSVILFSKVPLNELNGETIAVSRESLSSVTMLKILMKRRLGFKNEWVSVPQDIDDAFQRYRAALMIGDVALFYEPENWVYKYDLGKLWREWTDTPFVFSLWTLRRDCASECGAELRKFCTLLKENRSRHLCEPERLLKNALGVMPDEKKFVSMLGYFVNLRYDLDEEMIRGLLRFYDLAFRENLAPEPKPLEFFE